MLCRLRLPRFPSSTLPIVMLVPFLAALSCLFPLDNNQPAEPFGFTKTGNAADTIAPYGSLKIAFSRPVRAPDSVVFRFQPPYSEFQAFFNGPLDTATIEFVMPLDGATTYTITLAAPVAATDGSVLYPWEDTVKVRTCPAEQEPNGDSSLADTLKGKLFGSIDAANDTDWFIVSSGTANRFYLVSTGSSSSFDIVDAAGTVTPSPAYADPETLAAPHNAVRPLYLSVHAWDRSNSGYYEVGVVK